MNNHSSVTSENTDTGNTNPTDSVHGKAEERVKLRQELGLLEATAITIGSTIGSGIFITPKGVVQYAGSVGLSILVWISCGAMSLIGALCYAELGTSLPTSGGEYHYLLEAFGPIPAFMLLWVQNLIFLPTTNAIMALTFASYVVAPFIEHGCHVPKIAVQLLATWVICFLTWLNCFNIRLTTKIQNGLMFGKIAALCVIITAGFYAICNGHTENYADPMKDTTTDPGRIAVAFYSGIFAYNGWNTLNYMTEELKNPSKNLPRAIYISLPIVATVYVLTNIAYFSVLSPQQMIASDAIAVSFGDNILSSSFSWTMSVFVAMSSFGGLSVHIMTASRLVFVGARNGHFPMMFSLIKMSRMTPTPSIIFIGALSILYLCIPDVAVLINLYVFVFSLACLFVVTALMYLRWKRPDLPRPIKVSLFYPIAFFIICLFLTILPIYVRPMEVATATIITLTGLPVYWIFILRKCQPQWMNKTSDSLTKFVQKLFVSAVEENEDLQKSN